MGECSVDAPDCFAVVTARQGCAAFTGIVRDYGAKSFVIGGSPECCLANARMTCEDHIAGIHTVFQFKEIHDAAHTPGPGSNCAPFLRLYFQISAERAANACLPSILMVRLQVLVPGC